MGNTNMVYHSPKYWKEMRALRRKLQASSDKQEVTSYKLPGPRPISNANKGLIHKRQAPSNKRQAPSNPAGTAEPQAPSSKRQAPS